MTTATDFETQLDDNPTDWTLRSIYADWLEEHGNPRAESMRWMVANKKKPWRFLSHSNVQIWDWWVSDEMEPEKCDLIDSVFTELEGQPPEHYERTCRTYSTRTAAELDLHNALVKAGKITCALIEKVEA